MNSMTLEQKRIIIGLNHYIGEFHHRILEDAYGDHAAYLLLDKWISEVLGVDYRSDIYNNKEITEINKRDFVKNSFIKKFSQGWFIGDALKSRLYSLSYHNKQDEKSILDTENELKEMWNYFKSLSSELSEDKHEIRIKYLEDRIKALENRYKT